MSENDSSSRWGGIIELQPQQLVQVALLGFALGIIAWLVTLFARDIALTALLCSGSAQTACDASVNVANSIATLLVGVIGLLGLVKLSVYRPIIVVAAVVIGLWSLGTWTAGLPWFESIAWYGILYALLYAMFSWLVRPRSLVIVLLVVVPVTALIRLVSLL